MDDNFQPPRSMQRRNRVEIFQELWSAATPTERDQIRAIIQGVEHKRRELKAQAIEAIHFLNTKTGRNYRAQGATLDILLARLRSGATLQQIKAVIAKKSMEWRDNENMERYLRPKTLFGRENFENYLGEVGTDE